MRATLVGPVTRASLVAFCLACEASPRPSAPVSAPPPAVAETKAEACPSWASLDVSALPPLPKTPYTSTFERVWQTVREKHYDPTLGCKDWPALRERYGAALAAAKDEAAAYAAMNDLLGELGQSHFRVVAPSAGVADGPSGPARVPIQVRMIGEELVVVRPAIGGVESGIPRGAALLQIGERKAEAILARAREESARPNEVAFHAARLVDAALSGEVGRKISLVFRDPTQGDAETTREATCVMPPGELVSLGNLRNLPTVVEHGMLPDTKIGRVAFNYWMLPMVERVKAAIMELRGQGMEALILDLRGNPGGVGLMAIPVARMILREAGSLGTLKFREFAQEFNVAGDPAAFAGPVLILVDEGTASTSEIFAAGLRDLGRARLVGARPSAGAALPSLLERFDDGALLQYVVGDYHSAKGTVAEGDGLAPDIVAPETRADFAEGRDPVLAAAVAALSSRPGP